MIDCKTLAKDIKDEVKAEVAEIVATGARAPHLCVIQVGDDHASCVYIKNKVMAAKYTGKVNVLKFPTFTISFCKKKVVTMSGINKGLS